MNETIDQIYRDRRVVGQSGELHSLHSEIDREEGEFIYSLIDGDPSIRKTLEVGCAYGLSSLFICSALQGREHAHHTILDPYQYSDWDGVGIVNLKDAGIDFYEFLEDRSELAMPRIAEKESGTFDLILVDGHHTFDQTLVDCYFATRLLRVGGILVVDDISITSVNRAVKFIGNWPCYEKVGAVSSRVPQNLKTALASLLSIGIKRDTWADLISPRLFYKYFDIKRIRMLALKKVSDDERTWDWHFDGF